MNQRQATRSRFFIENKTDVVGVDKSAHLVRNGKVMLGGFPQRPFYLQEVNHMTAAFEFDDNTCDICGQPIEDCSCTDDRNDQEYHARKDDELTERSN